MRIEPLRKFYCFPCSYVGVGCAYEDIYKEDFKALLPEELKSSGYLSLDDANRFIRKHLKVRKKVYYRRKDRFTLKEFLENNSERCCICVLGHFIYVNGKDYWSYYDNDDDPVVCIWYLTQN